MSTFSTLPAPTSTTPTTSAATPGAATGGSQAPGDYSQSTADSVANSWKMTQLGVWSNQQFTAMQFVTEQANQLNNVIRGIASGGSKIAGEIKTAMSQNA